MKKIGWIILQKKKKPKKENITHFNSLIGYLNTLMMKANNYKVLVYTG